MSPLSTIDFDHLKPEEFEQYLPDLFATGEGRVSQDPRLQRLFKEHPDCLALVRDLETIAETAKSLFQPTEDPSDRVWSNIQSRLREEGAALGAEDEDPGEFRQTN